MNTRLLGGTGRIALAWWATIALALLGAGSAAAYPWPVKPFDRQHAIRGNFDDPRTVDGSLVPAPYNVEGFHSGVDIQVPDGTPVYAIEAGVVTRIDRKAIAVSSPDVSRAPPLVFGYWHIVPDVTPLQFVFAGQLLGHVAAGFGHVHLSERRDGRYVNPLRLGGLTPYVDHTAPVVGPLVVYRAGTSGELPLTGVTGRVDLAVQATDPPPIRPRAPWENVVLSPETLSWGGLYDGSWVPYGFDPLSVDFRSFLRLPLGDVYAPGTHMNEANRVGDYRYWLVRGVDTTMLGDGLHTIWVTATDVRGNRTARTLTFDVTNPGPFSVSAGTPGRP